MKNRVRHGECEFEAVERMRAQNPSSKHFWGMVAAYLVGCGTHVHVRVLPSVLRESVRWELVASIHTHIVVASQGK